MLVSEDKIQVDSCLQEYQSRPTAVVNDFATGSKFGLSGKRSTASTEQLWKQLPQHNLHALGEEDVPDPADTLERKLVDANCHEPLRCVHGGLHTSAGEGSTNFIRHLVDFARQPASIDPIATSLTESACPAKQKKSLCSSER